MHLLGNCMLIAALAAFVIAGFLSVVKDLLSRDVFQVPLWSTPAREDRSSPTTRDHKANAV